MGGRGKERKRTSNEKREETEKHKGKRGGGRGCEGRLYPEAEGPEEGGKGGDGCSNPLATAKRKRRKRREKE